MRQRWLAATISAIIFIFSVISLCTNELNFGLDFTGGTQAEVSFVQPVSVATLRNQLVSAGFTQAVVQAYAKNKASDNMYSVRVGLHKSLSQEQLKAKLVSAMPGATINSLEYIGPEVGQQLMTNG